MLDYNDKLWCQSETQSAKIEDKSTRHVSSLDFYNFQQGAHQIIFLAQHFSLEEDKEYNGLLSTLLTKINVRHDGVQTWLAPSTLLLKCAIIVSHFPFDTQHCHLQFGSFAFDSSRLSMNVKPLDLDLYEGFHLNFIFLSTPIRKPGGTIECKIPSEQDIFNPLWYFNTQPN